MPLLDIFKRKKGKKEAEEEREVKKPPQVEVEKKQEKKTKAKKVSLKAPLLLKEPHITEKATSLAQSNQYVFKVDPKTNKTELKKAIEKLYGVDILSVKIINLPRKKRRVGRREGFRKGYKKAIVKIEKGQSIEVMPK